MGLELTPRKRRRAIATVNEWLADPAFPKKTAKGWVLSEVRAWRAGKEKLEDRRSKMGNGHSQFADGRSKMGANSDLRTPSLELPADPNGGPGGDLFPPAGDALKEFLDLLEEKLKNPVKWQEAPIQKWQIDYLKQYRRHLFPGASADSADERRLNTGQWEDGRRSATVPTNGEVAGPLPDSESQKALAVRLAKHFAGRIRIDISEQQISKWKNGEGLPPGAQLPPAKLGNRFDTQAWADWIERTLMPKYGMNVDAQGNLDISIFELASRAEAQRKIDEGARIRIELEVARGKYIEVVAAERAAAGVARQYHEFWKARAEKSEPELARQKLMSLGVESVKVEEFTQWAVERARVLVDLVEAKCAEQVSGYREKLTTDGNG
jgi:hypothetical protein